MRRLSDLGLRDILCPVNAVHRTIGLSDCDRRWKVARRPTVVPARGIRWPRVEPGSKPSFLFRAEYLIADLPFLVAMAGKRFEPEASI